jgi:hypothetical protein
MSLELPQDSQAKVAVEKESLSANGDDDDDVDDSVEETKNENKNNDIDVDDDTDKVEVEVEVEEKEKEDDFLDTVEDINDEEDGGEEIEEIDEAEEIEEAEVAPMFAMSLSTHLLHLYNNALATDVNVICQDETFKLHSTVLIHGSGYFKELLDKDDDGNIDAVALGKSFELDFSTPIVPDAFRIVAESLYTGMIRGMNTTNVTSLLEACYHLQIERSYDACEQFMMEYVDHDNCLTYWLTAKLCDCPTVMKKSIGLFGRHLDSFKTTEAFLERKLDTVKELLGSDDLQVPSEKAVFEAVVGWIKFDVDERAACLDEMLSVVRLTYLPTTYLINVVGKEDMIEDDPKAMSTYSAALKLKLANGHGDSKPRHNVIYGVRRDLEITKKDIEHSDCFPNFITGIKNCAQGVGAGVKNGALAVKEKGESAINDLKEKIEVSRERAAQEKASRERAAQEQAAQEQASRELVVEETPDEENDVEDDAGNVAEDGNGEENEAPDDDLSETPSKAPSNSGVSFANSEEHDANGDDVKKEKPDDEVVYMC